MEQWRHSSLTNSCARAGAGIAVAAAMQTIDDRTSRRLMGFSSMIDQLCAQQRTLTVVSHTQSRGGGCSDSARAAGTHLRILPLPSHRRTYARGDRPVLAVSNAYVLAITFNRAKAPRPPPQAYPATLAPGPQPSPAARISRPSCRCGPWSDRASPCVLRLPSGHAEPPRCARDRRRR